MATTPLLTTKAPQSPTEVHLRRGRDKGWQPDHIGGSLDVRRTGGSDDCSCPDVDQQRQEQPLQMHRQDRHGQDPSG